MADLKRLAEKILATKNAAAPAEEGSIFEAAGRKAAELAAPLIPESASAALEKVEPALSMLNYPQTAATKAVSKLTGGNGDEESFAPIAQRIAKDYLPASMYNPGAARDIGYALDTAFPIPVPKVEGLKSAISAIRKERVGQEAVKQIVKDVAAGSRLPVNDPAKLKIITSNGRVPEVRTVTHIVKSKP